MAALGLEPGKEHWRDDNPTTFTGEPARAHHVLISGLTMAHDLFLQGALRGIGYKVKAIDVPDNSALTFGKEFGNRGQCNPTYFTVGNLVKYLAWLRDEQKMPGQGHRREPRVHHRRRLRPLPLRHLRHRVPQGAARLGLRGLPRAAVPAAGRPQAGHRRGAGPQDEPEVLHRAAEGDPDRRRAEHGRLPHPPLRGGARVDATRRSRRPRS